jgi:hypothetical protein
MEEMRNAYSVSVRKAEGKRPVGRPKRRWEENITIDPREIWWKGVQISSSTLCSQKPSVYVPPSK